MSIPKEDNHLDNHNNGKETNAIYLPPEIQIYSSDYPTGLQQFSNPMFSFPLNLYYYLEQTV